MSKKYSVLVIQIVQRIFIVKNNNLKVSRPITIRQYRTVNRQRTIKVVLLTSKMEWRWILMPPTSIPNMAQCINFIQNQVEILNFLYSQRMSATDMPTR